MNFKVSNSLKALAGMIALGIVLLAMGVQNAVVIGFVGSIAVCVLAKAADKFSTKQEAIAQAEESVFQQANVVSLAAYRNSGIETEVAA